MSSTTTTTTSTNPPLIDVDCNLWHKDLTSLQPKQQQQQNNSSKTATENDESSLSSLSELSILDEDAVVESNIVAMVSPSSTLEEAQRGLNMLRTRRKRQQQEQTQATLSSLSKPSNAIDILTTVGIHPYHVNDDDMSLSSLEESMNTIKELLTTDTDTVANAAPSLICAIGECGLDGSDGFPPLQEQIPWFIAQVELAMEYHKPLFVHERLAFTETIDILESCSTSSSTSVVPIIIHCFTGTPNECKSYIERGYSLSVSGFILKPAVGQNVRTCLEEGLIPLNKLMIETDAPYMGFDNCRTHYLTKQHNYVASLNSKKRKRIQNSIYPNVPSSLPLVLDEVIQCLNRGRSKRGEELLERNDVARITTNNAIRFFGFSKERHS